MAWTQTSQSCQDDKRKTPMVDVVAAGVLPYTDEVFSGRRGYLVYPRSPLAMESVRTTFASSPQDGA